MLDFHTSWLLAVVFVLSSLLYPPMVNFSSRPSLYLVSLTLFLPLGSPWIISSLGTHWGDDPEVGFGFGAMVCAHPLALKVGDGEADP